MKKILVSLLVLALCTPAMADVTFTVDTSTAGQATISYTCTEAAGPVGIALNVDADDPADEIDGISGIDSFFDIFVDFAFDEEDTGDGYTYAEGSTTASNAITYQTSAGVAPLPSNSFAICIAGLGGSEEPLDDSPTSATVAVLTGDPGGYTLCLNGTRAGVVDKNGTMATNLDDSSCISFTIAADECLTASHEDYTDWVSVGKPDSWCWERQCHGDGDNATEVSGRSSVWVGYNDVAVLLDAFKVASPTPAQLAADFNRRSEVSGRSSVRVGYDDVSVLLVYFKQATVPNDCLSDDHVNP